MIVLKRVKIDERPDGNLNNLVTSGSLSQFFHAQPVSYFFPVTLSAALGLNNLKIGDSSLGSE
jgi:hypothetical protein